MLRVARPALAVLLVAGSATVIGESLAGQQSQSPPTFRAETNIIEVDTVVTDAQGNAVRGLTKEDFTILDDGRPQPLANMSFVDVPVDPSRSSGPPRLAPVDVSSNDVPFNGRVYVLILDDVQVEQEYGRDVIKQATLFIERYFQERDIMAVVYTSGRKDVGQDFTNNRELLLAAVKKFNGRRSLIPAAAPLAIGATAPPAGGGRGGPPVPALRDPTQATVQADRTSLALSSLKFLRDLADWTAATMPAQHKSFVFFSQGVGGLGDADPDTLFLNANGSRIVDAMANAVAAATRANTSIFSIDPRGLSVAANGAAHFDDAPIEGHTSLQVLAEDTGGRAILRTNNVDAAFDRVVKDASSYYVLAYAVPPDRRPGSFHTISVRVNRPNVEVRSRVGYRLPGDTPAVAPQQATPALRIAGVSAEVQTALNSPLPALGVSLSVLGVPFKGMGKNASVLFVTEMGNLTLNAPDAEGRLRDEVELSSLVLGTTAVKGGRTDHVHVALLPETAQATQGAVRVLHRIELPPGTYKLRVAARDGNSGRVGSVFHDLEVPDFSSGKTPLAMSGLLLTSARAAQLTTPLTDARVSAVLEMAPSARRQFAANEEVLVFAEIYDTNTSPHQDAISTRVINNAGKAVIDGVETVASDEMNGNRKTAYLHKARVHLDGLPPGPYVLRIGVQSGGKSSAEASREVAFTIAP
jgi:VWFA-related protein